MSNEQVKNFQETGTLFSAKRINANIAKQVKEQKEASIQAFKQECRRRAMETAHYVERGQPISTVIASAEKVYQWLIKIVK